MKNYLHIVSVLLMLIVPGILLAQKSEPQTNDTTQYKTLIPEAKQGLLRDVSIIANMNYAMRNEFYDHEYQQTRFRMDQFRLEIKGQITDKLYFRFRDRYTRAQTSESMDNLSHSVDLAYIRVDATDKLSISIGKMCADWGAWEFDWNPIDIYEYSDIIEYADNFLTGVGVSYQATRQHLFTFQALDSRTKSFNELYGDQPNFTASKVPLAFVANWRGNLFDGKVNTIWSYSYLNEATEVATGDAAGMNYLALGTELNLGKFRIIYDFKWSDENLDRTGIISGDVPDDLYAYALGNTEYIGHWVNLRYIVSPKIHLTCVGMLDAANWNNNFNDPENLTGENHIRNAYGIIPAVEYFPWSDLNIKFFVNYIGRDYEYSDYAKTRFGATDYSTSRITIGFISPLGIL